MRERRLVRVPIAPIMLEQWVKGGQRWLVDVVEGVPPDAELVDAYWDSPRQLLYLVFEHRTFRPVLLGDVIPQADVTVRLEPA